MNVATLTRADLDRELAELRSWVPTMLVGTDEASQMDAFAGRADEIESRTSPDDHEHFWSTVQGILRDYGLVSGDDEHCDGQPRLGGR